MTRSNGAIRSVIVVGGGIVGWSAAAALRQRLPWVDVGIVPQPVPSTALADTMPCTLPSIVGFHADLGLSDQDTVVRTGSSYRLGTVFAGWGGERHDYFHGYGTHGRPLGAISFHLHWARLAANDAAAPFDHHAPAAMLARAGRFARSFGTQGAMFAGLEYGLHLDVARYRAMIRTFALHCAVREMPGAVTGVQVSDDSFVDRIVLHDGTVHRADLFIDASGPDACLRGAIDAVREDWSGQFACDRILLADGPPSIAQPPFDTVTTTAGGWRWRAASGGSTQYGHCYASAFCDDATAASDLVDAYGVAPATAPIVIAPGARRAPWRGNCVAIGDAATVVEPLEWSNLHLAHSAIDRIIAMIPGADCAPVELAEYNRQAYAEAMRVRDFVLLHYAVSARPEPFWRAAAAVDPSPSLAHSLALFRERGRLPVYEEETFARDSWLAVLFGQGVLPRRIDPLADAVPAHDVAQAMAEWRRAIDASLPHIPTHAEYLSAQRKQIA